MRAIRHCPCCPQDPVGFVAEMNKCSMHTSRLSKQQPHTCIVSQGAQRSRCLRRRHGSTCIAASEMKYPRSSSSTTPPHSQGGPGICWLVGAGPGDPELVTVQPLQTFICSSAVASPSSFRSVLPVLLKLSNQLCQIHYRLDSLNCHGVGAS